MIFMTYTESKNIYLKLVLVINIYYVDITTLTFMYLSICFFIVLS
jgi:hypothetical protein